VFRRELASRLYRELSGGEALDETTPGVSGIRRLEQARAQIAEACDGWMQREALSASLTNDERKQILRGMCLTRAVDNRLKQLYLGGEVRWGMKVFPGKGFRSLGQEAIYAGALRLKRGRKFRGDDGTWTGDVAAPMIRDLGFTLAMHGDEDAVAMILRAQLGKGGPPLHGKDLHTGDFSWGVLPAAAPLGIGTMTMTGMAMAFARQSSSRVAVSFIGDGGSSLGEWHEAINTCAVAKLPAIFCVQNNQTALSTPVAGNTAARVFADKALGYGIPGVTIDGTDADAVAGAFAWAAERARSGAGPALIELVAMRMCGHAHHDDMLYLGKEMPPSWDYPDPQPGGYVDPELYEFWAARDPIARYAARLEAERVINSGELGRLQKWAETLVEAQAKRVVDEAWPEPHTAGVGVFANEAPRTRVEVLDPARRTADLDPPPLPALAPGRPVDAKGRTFLDGIMLGVGDALRAEPRVFVYGQDVAGPYGNAFLLLKPLVDEFGDRLVNSTLAEGAVLGVCVGAALAGERPIGEMQFNDFVATGFNQLVNNAAKIRYRWGAACRWWCACRGAACARAGRSTARTPRRGSIARPASRSSCRPRPRTRVDCSRRRWPIPIPCFSTSTSRSTAIRGFGRPSTRPRRRRRRSAWRRCARAGSDLAIISYGAYVHECLRVAETLAKEGIEARCSTCGRSRRSIAPRCWRWRNTAGACSSCTKTPAPAASARASPPSSRKKRSSGSMRRSACWERSIRRCRMRRRSRSSTS
jgi:TPP-dependent pyruvate/acetoin dehydrogenase alpha subunit